MLGWNPCASSGVRTLHALFIGILLLVVLLTAISAPLTSCQSVDQAPPQAPGQLIDLGGRKLHLYCTGSGPPTVILEAGAGSFSTDWVLIQTEIAKTTRACSYDRAGYGWSDPGPEWDTVTQVESDLHAALNKAGVHAPLVLVGHSMGRIFARWYQQEHRDDVIGMVLIESYETTAPVNGKPVPLYTLTKELQTNLPPPSSLKKPPLPTGLCKFHRCCRLLSDQSKAAVAGVFA